MADTQGTGLTGLGKMISVVLVLGLLGLGGWIVFQHLKGGSVATPPIVKVMENDGRKDTVAKPKGNLNAGDWLADMQTSVPALVPAMAYVPKGKVVDIELSHYAGYSGLIAANGGLEPNADSYFAKKYGFELRIALSEEESWNKLNSGGMAASATTVDVLAVYGKQMQVVLPAQISYSRGADGLVVRSEIKRFNQLKGKIVAAEQFTESDFFVRYLTQLSHFPTKF